MDKMVARKVAVVRETISSKIVDALLLEEAVIGKRNLSAELLDRWPPFTYYVQTIVTSNLRNYFSGADIQRIEKLARANDEGASLAKPPARRIECNLSDSVKLGTYKRIIENCFKEYDGDVAIATGEAHYKIYDQEIYQAIKNALSSSKSRTTFVCGPVLVVDDRFRDNKVAGSIVPLLGELENLDLYYTPTRLGVHFRLGGGERLYVEEPHTPAAEIRFGWLFDKNNEIGARFGNVLRHMIQCRGVRKSKKPKTDFLFLTQTELNRLKKACSQEQAKSGKAQFEYSKKELIQIIENHHIL